MGDFSFELSPRYQKEREEKEAAAEGRDKGSGLSYEEYGKWVLENGENEDNHRQPQAGELAGSELPPVPKNKMDRGPLKNS